MSGERQPVPAAKFVQEISASFGRVEMPTVFLIARFHAGRMWVAPLGTPFSDHDGAGTHPDPEWIEIDLHG